MKIIVLCLLCTISFSLHTEEKKEQLEIWLSQLATQDKEKSKDVYTKLLQELNKDHPEWVRQLSSNKDIYEITNLLAKYKKQDLAIAILFYHLLQKWPNSNYAGKSLATMGPQVKVIIPFLEAQLSNPDFAVRNNTLIRLGLLRSLAKETALKMANLVNDPHPKVRKQALEELGHVQPSGDVIPILRNVLQNDKFSQEEKELALYVLKQIKSPTTIVSKELIALLQHPSISIRSLVAEILEANIPTQAKDLIDREEQKRKAQRQKEQKIAKQQEVIRTVETPFVHSKEETKTSTTNFEHYIWGYNNQTSIRTFDQPSRYIFTLWNDALWENLYFLDGKPIILGTKKLSLEEFNGIVKNLNEQNSIQLFVDKKTVTQFFIKQIENILKECGASYSISTTQ